MAPDLKVRTTRSCHADPTPLFELRRGHAVALRAKAEAKRRREGLRDRGGSMRRALALLLTFAIFVPARSVSETQEKPAPGAQRQAISSKPDTPFKLATFEAGGKVRLGLALGSRILDIAGANAALIQNERLPEVRIPAGMRELIDTYDRVSPRLYQIANYSRDAQLDGAPYVFDVEHV